MKEQLAGKKIALIGNPNSGKTSLFNSLTGLHQHVANFPGVTVDIKVGDLKLKDNAKVKLIDFPGTYSLYPNSDEEKIVGKILTNVKDENFPDAVIYVMDPFDIKREMLLLSQLNDIGIPVVVVLTMRDLAEKRGVKIDTKKFSNLIGSEVVFFSNKTQDNTQEIKDAVFNLLQGEQEIKKYYQLDSLEQSIVDSFKGDLNARSDYQALLQIHHSDWLDYIDKGLKQRIKEKSDELQFKSVSHKINETLSRYKIISKIATEIKSDSIKNGKITGKIDTVVTNRILGSIIFFVMMLFLFQAMFSWSELPMAWLEDSFAYLSELVVNNLPDAWYTSLIADGILPGLAGVLVFIPQIFILFLLIGILEEVGYMARVVYLFDEIMQKFGMNGRSMIALISAGACAVPAIMSARTISNYKERLITIFVTPFISCAARIPVYTLLVIFAVPDTSVGMFNARGLALMGLYLLGILMTLISAVVMKYLIKHDGRSYLIMELPEYRKPILKNLTIFLKEKVGAFMFVAGKIIFIVSIILWFLASYGPSNSMQTAESEAMEISKQRGLDEVETANLVASEKLEHSYIGIMGKTIEPVIEPLGFDWKIGIGIISSFAAREVFVGTLATIYSLGSGEDEMKISDRLSKEVNIKTGEKTYNSAVAWSLLLFYVFALQCMSTVAVVRKETGSWKWAILQFVYMGLLAYVSSFLVYNFLS